MWRVLANGQELEREEEFIAGGTSFCKCRGGKNLNSWGDTKSEEVRKIQSLKKKMGFAFGLM